LSPIVGALQAGEWLVLAIGVAGLHDDSASWGTLTVNMTAPFHNETLGRVPVACGWGFQSLEGQQAAVGGMPANVPDVQVGGHLGLRSPFGAFFWIGYPEFGLTPADQATVTLNGTTYSLDDVAARGNVTAQGPADLSLDIGRWADQRPLWVAAGLWVPPRA